MTCKTCGGKKLIDRFFDARGKDITDVADNMRFSDLPTDGFRVVVEHCPECSPVKERVN